MGNTGTITRRKTALAVTISSLLTLAHGPAFAAFPAPPSFPCESQPNCAHNGMLYSDGSFVTQEVSEYADGGGERTENFTSIGYDGWRINAIGDSAMYTYITGRDEYDNPIIEYYTSYASAPVVLAEGKSIDMRAMAASGGGGGRITNLADGIDGMDAVNKRQLDSALSNAGGNDPLAVKYSDAGRSTVMVNAKMVNVQAGEYTTDAANMGQVWGVQNIAQDGVNKANAAQISANDAITTGWNAQQTANQAGADAINAGWKADNAMVRATTGVTNAATAQARADLGVTNAATAQARADQGVANAATAQARADLGVSRADQGLSNAATAQARADLGVTNAATAQARADLGVTNAAIAQSRADYAASGVTALDNLAVKYSDADHRAVQLGATEAGPVQLGNVADGVADTDAVNLAQLRKVAGDLEGVAGDSLLFDGVTYSANRAGTATRISGVADGVAGGDAVNKSQLDTVQAGVDDLSSVAVKYTDTTRSAVVLGTPEAGAVRMSNVADGMDSLDAVNKSQLDTVQAGVDDLSSVAVKYTDTTRSAVVLGTPEAGAVRMSNVADGVDSLDAVNKSQLDTVRDELAGVAGDALLFDGTAYNAQRSGIATRISGVADGVDSADAVNKSQLDTVQAGVDDLSSVAVKYTDTTRSAVVLGTPEAGAVRMSNVADGVDSLDAVNKSQLDTVRDELAGVAGDALLFDGTAYNAERAGTATRITGVAAGINPTDATNFTQLSALTSALGAGAGWSNGGFTGPQYRIGSMDFGNVGDAFAAVDGKLAGLEGRVSDVEQSPAITRPVIYDDASKDALTLEGPGGTRISNLAAGVNGTDAANLNQVRQGVGESRAYTDTKAQQTLTESKAYTDSRIADVWGGMDDFSRQVNMQFGEINQRIDRQSAMTSAMVQMATNAGGSRSEFGRIGAGIGWSGGQRALSVGWSKAVGRGSFSFGGAISGGESSAGIGFGIDL